MLEEFVTAKPADSFARYGLAMECMSSGDDEAAVTHFQLLLDHNAQYVPAYLQFAQALARLARNAEARRVLLQGIHAATKAGDSHARDEMQAAMDALA